MYRFFHVMIEKIIINEQSPYKLALSSCFGIFLACAPFLGVQTFLAFILSWLFSLNITVVLIMLCTINNPITMVPIILIDYFVGYLICDRVLHVSLAKIEPSWLSSINQFIAKKCSHYIAIDSFSIWNYLIGGVIFATVCSVTSYPLLYALFKRMKLHHTDMEEQKK